MAEDLTTVDFPHEHSKECLSQILKIFRDSLSRLNSISLDDDQKAIKSLCSAELRKVFEIFPLFGFILRSTDVRNAFEIHRPFLEIVKAILGPDSKLIVSSEWDYSPFTFLPRQNYGLNNIVMIGIPATESENALILPLAGHELGHNVWAAKNYFGKYGIKAQEVLLDYIVNDRWEEFSDCFDHVTKDNIDDIVGKHSWEAAWSWALRQSEELFCDFLGLALFGESFLHAFAYLLAPGLPQARIEHYPGSRQRAQHQSSAANSYGLTIPENFIDLFDDEDIPSERKHKLLLTIADHVVSMLVQSLAQDAQNVVRDAGFSLSSMEARETIVNCLEKGVPAQRTPGVEAIVNAAWDFFLSDMSGWEQNYPQISIRSQNAAKMLSELVFKSIEIYDFELRTSERDAIR